MPSESETVEIVICLGSSCFARGNAENLETLSRLMREGLKARVCVTGRLCQDQCKNGPNLSIAGCLHHGVRPERLRELLREANTREGNHGTP
jgi:NADH:ubiquinone oxidoreductase subunit E